MADKGIIFSAPMVRALLDGRKTHTRRLLNPQPYDFVTEGNRYWNASGVVGGRICISDVSLAALHRWRVGDRLWIKERHYVENAGYQDGSGQWINYEATTPDAPNTWTSARHMPKFASRVTLTVTEVRVQRLQEIGEGDAIAEGIERAAMAGHWWDYGPDAFQWSSAVLSYRSLWNSLHTKPGERWEVDPWIVAISFDVQHGNIDRLTPAMEA